MKKAYVSFEVAKLLLALTTLMMVGCLQQLTLNKKNQ